MVPRGGRGGMHGPPGGPGDDHKKPSLMQILIGVCVLLLIFALPSITSSFNSANPEGVRSSSSTSQALAAIPPRLTFYLIADLDTQSHLGAEHTPTFKSFLQIGTLLYDQHAHRFGVEWGETKEILTRHNEGGRGMELSELVNFNGRLFTMDDRTGIVFELRPGEQGPDAIPKYIVMEGDGAATKGQKLEWATVKDGLLHVGSIGKEFTLPDGKIASTGALWVTTIDASGHMRHIDWTRQYNALRDVTGTRFPGYLLHEAVCWSDAMQKWVVLPRRVSDEPYNELLDEKKGSNMVIVADETFTNIETHRVGTTTPERGFSSFKFVPNTGDRILAAIKSEENSETGYQTAYMTVISLDGEVLMDEIEVPGKFKFEGIEFEA